MSDTDPLAAARHMWGTVGSYPTMGDVFAAVRAGAAHVTGVDLTPELLAEASRRAEADGLADRVTWHESDMAALPVADSAHDRVLSRPPPHPPP
jgi:tRNA1(Val) A37 N6-methylase TrmN6